MFFDKGPLRISGSVEKLVPSSKRRLIHQLQSQAEMPLVRVNSLSLKERKDNIGSSSPDLIGVRGLVKII